MSAPPAGIVDKVAPAHPIGSMPVRDTRGIYPIPRKALKGTLRLPRTGRHKAELIATFRHYDGATGGEAGYYANLFLVFQPPGRARLWRTQGVRVLPAEAGRIARALRRGKPSRPGRYEEPRLSGTGSGNVTELRASVVGTSVLLYVRYIHAASGEYVRTRGVEVLEDEREPIAAGLEKLFKRGSRAR